MFGTPADLRLDAGSGEFGLQRLANGVDELFSLDTLLLEHACDALVGVRFEKTKGKILEFPLELPGAETARDGRVNLPGLEREPVLLVRPCLGVAEPKQLFGDAYQDEPRVRDDRQQHSSQRIRLLGCQGFARLPVVRQCELPKLNEPVHRLNAVFQRPAVEVTPGQPLFPKQRVQEDCGLQLRLQLEGPDRVEQCLTFGHKIGRTIARQLGGAGEHIVSDTFRNRVFSWCSRHLAYGPVMCTGARTGIIRPDSRRCRFTNEWIGPDCSLGKKLG